MPKAPSERTRVHRHPTPEEFAQTIAFAVPIEEASAKVRTDRQMERPTCSATCSPQYVIHPARP